MKTTLMDRMKANEEGPEGDGLSPKADAGSNLVPDGGLEEQSARRQCAIYLLLEGKSVTEVAEAMGVHRATVHRWLNDPEFGRELARKRDAFFESAIDLQSYGAVQGTLKLLELLDSKAERVALQAASRLASFKQDYAAIDQERRIRKIEDEADLSVSLRKPSPRGGW